jgi:hypothetical protein
LSDRQSEIEVEIKERYVKSRVHGRIELRSLESFFLTHDYLSSHCAGTVAGKKANHAMPALPSDHRRRGAGR